MDINQQITFSLLIILVFQTLIHTIVVLRLRFEQRVKEGLDIGQKIPNVTFEDINGDIEKINNMILEKARLFIFLDLNCKECKKVLSLLDVFNEKYLNEVKLILLKSEDNLRYIANSIYRYKSIFIEEDIIQNQFKIRSFPFIIKVDGSGKVENKGYINKYNLIDYINP